MAAMQDDKEQVRSFNNGDRQGCPSYAEDHNGDRQGCPSYAEDHNGDRQGCPSYADKGARNHY